MYNSLQIKIMGMIESKKKNKVKKQDAYNSEYQSEAPEDAEIASAGGAAAQSPIKRGNTIVKGQAAADERLTELEKRNEELMLQLEAARRANS